MQKLNVWACMLKPAAIFSRHLGPRKNYRLKKVGKDWHRQSVEEDYYNFNAGEIFEHGSVRKVSEVDNALFAKFNMCS